MNDRYSATVARDSLRFPRPGLPARQVVTLGFLSGLVPPSLLTLNLATALCSETHESVVLVRLVYQDEEALRAPFPAPHLNGEFHLPAQLDRDPAGFAVLTLGIRSDPPTPPGIESLISQLSSQFQNVLIQTPPDASGSHWFFEFVARSSAAYLFFAPASSEPSLVERVVAQARATAPGQPLELKPVACLSRFEHAAESSFLAKPVFSQAQLFVHDCPAHESADASATTFSPAFLADLRRLAREIGGCLVGLALSSGAAKGFAHIGVIQVLEENGIEVDVIAGSSMGAYVGSLYACGCNGAELERLARELESPWALWTLIDPAFPPRRGFLRGYAVKKRLMRTLGHARFADLKRPFRVVAANLATLEQVVFSSGEVGAAVHASIAVPGICVPVQIDGGIYTDGGIVDPLPVDVLRTMGVSRVIAVNVIPTPERIRRGIQSEMHLVRRNRTRRSRLFQDVLPLNRQMNYFARGNLLEILMRSVHGAQIRMAEASCKLADVVLRPDIFDDSWLDYRHPGRFIELGRKAAEENIDVIKALVGRKEVFHERQPAPEQVAEFI